ncbi:GNAT family N-acetyltransferase [Chitinilyticum piscinae]|uniref:GNAT family N-acetyltransferase n=1 Tax=Chitinilyticum piscinae TaxID=2866724 RepID=A0A8J7FL17_9NEIS|nr:GNAT family protein [Chitinilyticum piscinae]MBE9609720.1 GNAT family N-acetyltransferase [Chitinilyticum piscinae]
MPEPAAPCLQLSALTLADAAALLPIWSDREVTRFTYVRGVRTLADSEARIQGILAGFTGIGPWVVREAGEVIGFAGAVRLPGPDEFEVFYHFARSSWGRGIGKIVLQRLLQAAFVEHGACCVHAGAVAANPASWHLLEQAGFRRSGVREQGFRTRSGCFDLYHYTLLRPSEAGQL